MTRAVLSAYSADTPYVYIELGRLTFTLPFMNTITYSVPRGTHMTWPRGEAEGVDMAIPAWFWWLRMDNKLLKAEGTEKSRRVVSTEVPETDSSSTAVHVSRPQLSRLTEAVREMMRVSTTELARETWTTFDEDYQPAQDGPIYPVRSIRCHFTWRWAQE